MAKQRKSLFNGTDFLRFVIGTGLSTAVSWYVIRWLNGKQKEREALGAQTKAQANGEAKTHS